MKRIDIGTTVLTILTILVALAVLVGPRGPVSEWVRRWRLDRQRQTAVQQAQPALRRLGQHIEVGQRPSVIFEFSDYECPYCRQTDVSVRQWLNSQHGVGVVYLHFPLAIHAHAGGAARAAVCAGQQGHFREMHHELMSTSLWQTDTNWVREASLAGVPDLRRFQTCTADSATAALVTTMRHLGDSLGIQGTPTFIGGRRWHVGAASPDDLNRLPPLQQ